MRREGGHLPQPTPINMRAVTGSPVQDDLGNVGEEDEEERVIPPVEVEMNGPSVVRRTRGRPSNPL
jgi:hypothetical protein